ncbi:hypothetical protein [Negativibacillus massiliensis]
MIGTLLLCQPLVADDAFCLQMGQKAVHATVQMMPGGLSQLFFGQRKQ